MGMLVLGRRVGQRIQIGDDIELTVVAIEGDKVKLGFVAPSRVRIMRTELLAEEDADKESKKATHVVRTRMPDGSIEEEEVNYER